jgi:ketosteroid isomerase-like protein
MPIRRLAILMVVTLILGVRVERLIAQHKADAASEILNLEARWCESYKDRNITNLSNLLADEFFITVEDGTTYAKPGYIAHTRDMSIHVIIAEMSDLKCRVHGNTAVVTGSYHEKGTSKGKIYEYHDRFTDVWINNNGKWQVLASHYSVPFQG